MDTHGKEANRIFFSYVYECDGKSKKEKAEVLKKWNKVWLDYCFKHRKHKISPPSPDTIKMLSKDLKMINKVQLILGLEVTKSWWSRVVKNLMFKK